MPLRIQGHCGFGRGLSLLNWVWCNRRGPHLEWRQEAQGSSPFLTRVAGYLQSMDKRVTPRLLWRNGSPLAFRVVHGVTGHLLSCLEPAVFSGRCTVVSLPLRVVPSSKGLPSKRCLGIGFFSRAYRKIGVFQHVVPPTKLRLEFPRETGLILRCAGKLGNPLQTKQGNRPTGRDQKGRRGSDEVVPGTSVVPSSETGMSRHF